MVEQILECIFSDRHISLFSPFDSADIQAIRNRIIPHMRNSTDMSQEVFMGRVIGVMRNYRREYCDEITARNRLETITELNECFNALTTQ